jgi:fucose permease
MIPHCTAVAALAVPFALIGGFAGCVDVGCNTLVVWHTRGAGSARLLNALHLFFGVGALASPLLVDRSLVWSHGLGLLTTLVAVYALVLAVIVMLHETPTPFAAGTSPISPSVQTPVRVLAVISVFFFLYVGVEVGFAGWIKTYAEGIHLPGASSPTLLNTAFWVSFTLGRLIAVVVASRVRSGTLLAASCTLTIALLGVMIIADGSPTAVWLTTVLIGFAVAPQFATMIAYAEEHIALSGRSTSWFVSGSGLGGLALPFLIGQMLDRSGSAAMPVAVFFAAIAAAGWLLVVRHELLIRGNTAPEPVVAAPVTR